MQKIGIIAHSSLREELITMLQDEGVLEVRPAGKKVEVDHTEVNYQKAEVEYAITTLKDSADKATLTACSKPVSVETVLHTVKNTDVLEIVDTLHELEKNDTEANRNIGDLQKELEKMHMWRNVRKSFETETETETTVRIIGSLPESNEKKLHDSIIQSLPRSVTEVIARENGLIQMVAYIWKDDIRHFEEIATTLGWTNEYIPETTSTPADAYEQICMQIKQQEQHIAHNQKQRQKLSVELPKLMQVRTFMHWMDAKQDVRESMAVTDSTVTILGWAPRTSVAILESHLQKLSMATAVIKVKPDEGEEPPVLLKNSKLITPFESVTSLYGLPLPSEMDPTKALSPFFALYFGLCLTDAGYGAVIALIFGIYLLTSKKSIQEAPLWWLLFMSGIVTFFVSIPFGGWFGLTPEQVPAFLTRETPHGRMFLGQLWNLNHQSGISFLQNLSMVLGLTHIFFGVFLAGLHKWIHGNKAGAFWQHFTAHLVLGSALFLAFAPASLGAIPTYILYTTLALMVWGQGYGNPWYLRPVMGALGVVNFAIGLLSNGLSYLRILALGLVTGAIALAVNQVAIELGRLMPLWVGIPVTIGIAVAGHTVSIALNTLGSFIHSGRLQFIEFFSQFFEGGGKAFSPFKRSFNS